MYLPPGSGRRIRRLMLDTCNLYRPARLEPQGTTLEAADPVSEYVPVFTAVPCHYEPASEMDVPRGPGLSKSMDIMTMDKFHFLQDQQVGDTWKIELTTVGHPGAGSCWIAQGGTLMNASKPGRATDSQWCFANLSPDQELPRVNP